MTDRQDRHDDKHAISQNLQSITTGVPNLNINEQSSNDATMSKFKNASTINPMHERKKKPCSPLDENNWLTNDLPGMNLPEKILFVIDTVRETDCTPFEARTGGKFFPLYMIKRVVEIFVSLKSGIQAKHEYGLMTLESDRVTLISDFTANRKDFFARLDKIEEEQCELEEEIYDLDRCFQAICDCTNMDESTSPPVSVSRVIFIYARSRTIPIFLRGRKYFERLSRNPHFYLDCLYVHEPPSDENHCQKIYERLGSLDFNETSYILEVGRNLAALHTNMAKLIAHPLQRARQDDSPYTFCNPASPQDTQTNL